MPQVTSFFRARDYFNYRSNKQTFHYITVKLLHCSSMFYYVQITYHYTPWFIAAHPRYQLKYCIDLYKFEFISLHFCPYILPISVWFPPFVTLYVLFLPLPIIVSVLHVSFSMNADQLHKK